MYSMDDFLRFQSVDGLGSLDRTRDRAGIRTRTRGHDVNAYLAACGLKAKRR